MSLHDDSAFSEAPTPKELAAYDLNDYGHAMRLIRLSGGRIDDNGVDIRHSRLLYVIGIGWIGFHETHWDSKFGDVLARRTAHAVGQKMRDPAVRAELVDKHALDPISMRKFLDQLGQAGSTSAMLKQAESYLTVEIDAFDTDPMLINCRNFTLKVGLDKDGKLKVVKRPHSPADRITRMVDVDYDPQASAELYVKVFQESLPDPEISGFFKRCMGYAITGQVYEQAFFILQGKGRDGKSTLLDAAREVMGGYGGVGDINTFLETTNAGASGASPDLIKLAGDVRLVVLSEPQRGAKFHEGRLKAWTSGSPITARQLREAPIDFRPKGKLFVECNALPVVRGDDEGIWRRANVIPFENQVDPDKVDKQLPQKLRGEFPGIFNWLLEGVGDWLRRGLDRPDAIRKVLDDYRRESSPFGDWLTTRCVFSKGAEGRRELSKDLYGDYKAWCEEQGHDTKQVMSIKAFGTALTQRQIRPAGLNSQGLQYRGPIRLKSKDELAQDIARTNGGPPGVISGGASATPRGTDDFENDPLSMEGDPFA